MIGEVEFLGIFLSTLMPCFFVGLILSQALRILMKSRDLYRFIWHPPLFDLALLFVCVAVAVGGLRLINMAIN
jgi:hypothetical protein